MAGRPTKLTDEVAEQICEVLASGAYLETAAEAVGIDPGTVWRWLDRGAKGEEPFSAFRESVVRARAKAELDMLATVRAGDGKGTSFGPARGAAFLLERTRPQRYAQRVNVKVEEAVTRVLEVARGICPPEDFTRILEGLERLDSEGGESLPGATDEGADLH
jgi:hypothetical protein